MKTWTKPGKGIIFPREVNKELLSFYMQLSMTGFGFEDCPVVWEN
jgi:hypothetical protein